MPNVYLTPDAAAEFAGLPRPIRTRTLKMFERLSGWPDVSGAKALKGRRAGAYRMRTGDYRVQFRVEGGQVIIEKIGHRDRFYED